MILLFSVVNDVNLSEFHLNSDLKLLKHLILQFFKYSSTVIRGNFGQISIILPNQLSNTNLQVVFLAIIMSASAKTNFLVINFVY